MKGLHDQGYTVDVLCQTPQNVVWDNNPYVNKLIVVDREQIPNDRLTEFWAHWGSKYDKMVNLSECVEGSLLAMPGRSVHFWSPKARETIMNHCYQTIMHEIAGVPDISQCKFFPSIKEKAEAFKKTARNRINVMYCVNGSSVHKMWAGCDQLFARIFTTFPDVHIWTVGGMEGKIIEAGWENEPRVHKCCGDLSIRDTATLAQYCDMAIGPETGFMNVVSNEDIPKVLLLSHSTMQNYINWTNTHYIRSAKTVCPGRGNNEAEACHQLHYGWTHCKVDAKGEQAQCQADIDIEDVWRAAGSELSVINMKKETK